MLIQAINGINLRSKNKTQSIPNKQYVSKVNSNNIGDTVSFGELFEAPKMTKKTLQFLKKVAIRGKELSDKNPNPNNTKGLCLEHDNKLLYIFPNADNNALMIVNKQSEPKSFMTILLSDNKITRTQIDGCSDHLNEFWSKGPDVNKTVQKYLNLLLEKGTQHRNVFEIGHPKG